MGNQIELYKKAIDILHNSSYEPDKMLVIIAKKHPKIFCDAYDATKPATAEEKIQNMAGDGKSKIDCIKHYRGITGKTLDESLRTVERLVPKFNSH